MKISSLETINITVEPYCALYLSPFEKNWDQNFASRKTKALFVLEKASNLADSVFKLIEERKAIYLHITFCANLTLVEQKLLQVSRLSKQTLLRSDFTI